MPAALRTLICLLLSLIFAGSSSATEERGVRFAWISYSANANVDHDPARYFRNPVIPGFHPDPSVVRVGKDYFLVNSSFGWLPGLPVYHSRDLVNWRQIGNAINDVKTFPIDKVGINRGIFAPTLRWHKGIFYLISTCIDCGGNFLIMARKAAGPWSKPVWLKEIGGIDPDIFFDDDGRVWITNNDEPEGPAAYDGHRALWIREYNPATRKLTGKAKVVVDRGVKPEDKPIWTEGPHIFKKDGFYYLTAAEGGTADGHTQTIYRSNKVDGPYEPGPANPILTQRDLDPGRPQPVYATGHADSVQLANGDWWAVFLGTRPYERNLTNLGRETFLLPITWANGWPIILPPGAALPSRLQRPATGARAASPAILNWRENFAENTLGPKWLTRRPLLPGWLKLSPKGGLYLGGDGTRSFIGRRLQHHHATIETEINLLSETRGSRAGLLAMADENHMLFFGLERGDAGNRLIVAARAAPGASPSGNLLHASDVEFDLGSALQLRVIFEGEKAHFYYRSRQANWTDFLKDVDTRILATQYDGLLFTGAIFGPYVGVGLP